MHRRRGTRPHVSAATAGGLLTLLLLIRRDWIETLFHVDPDRHNGSFEWILAATFASVPFAFAALGRRRRRRGAAPHATQMRPSAPV